MKPLKSLCLVLLSGVAFLPDQSASAADATRPNVVWIFVDDMSANFSCYGEKLIQTSHVDRLASEGTRFSRAFVTAPVCSACRSALITGCYQTSIGAHNHRSGRGELKIHLPDGVVPVPTLFRQAGYYTCIGSGKPGGKGLGKTDYNFEWDPKMYDGADWSGRREGQPFFMQVMLSGGKLRGGNAKQAEGLSARAAREFGSATNPEDVTLPPYYPRDPVELADWAAYLDACRFTDKSVGEVVARLESEGVLNETLVVFMTDHGISHARGKQFLYNEGTHVPLVIRGPGIAKGVVRDDLVMQIDLPALSLAAAGIPIPASMHGRDILAKDYQPRDTVFAARDRCDETTERIRSVRTDRWLYIRNFHPQRPHLQPNNYKDGKSIVQTLRELHEAGKLDPLQDSLLFSPTRPEEELYEWTTDRYQVTNLAGDPSHQDALASMRAKLARWMEETNDRGRTPETEAMYDSDMAAYLGQKGAKKSAGRTITEQNVAQMKQWAKEGK